MEPRPQGPPGTPRPPGRGPGWGLFLVFLVLEVVHFVLVLRAPEEKTLGLSQKAFYYHLPAAITCFLSYFFALCTAGLYLATRRSKFDHGAAACVEIGLLFNALTLATGSIWARNDWGVWWAWYDMRLVTTLIMAFLYLGYVWLRRALPPGERRALVSSVYAIVAFANVPLVYWSLQLFGEANHPPKIGLPEPGMRYALWAGFAAFFVLWPWLAKKRTHLMTLAERVDWLRSRRASEEPAFR